MAATEKDYDMVCEPVATTYGMSDQLLSSGLLTQISGLSTADKKCLISYIAQEVASDEDIDDDALWDTYDSGLPPYTLEELHARIEESHQQYLRGEYVTAEESDAELKKEFPWLR